MPARWGNGLLGCVKINSPPSFNWARVPSSLFSLSSHVCLRLFLDCQLCLGGSICCSCCGYWLMVGWEPVFLRLFFSVTPRAVWDQFLDIPSGTRDLTRHLEDLTWRYPVEPVERTCLRFCEALSQWHGKPELEKVSPHLRSTLPTVPFSPRAKRTFHSPTILPPPPTLPRPFSLFPFSLACVPRVLELISLLHFFPSCWDA